MRKYFLVHHEMQLILHVIRAHWKIVAPWGVSRANVFRIFLKIWYLSLISLKTFINDSKGWNGLGHCGASNDSVDMRIKSKTEITNEHICLSKHNKSHVCRANHNFFDLSLLFQLYALCNWWFIYQMNGLYYFLIIKVN